jgi:WD40 repeat protein
VRFWDVETGRTVSHPLDTAVYAPAGPPLLGVRRIVKVRFSSDGRRALTYGRPSILWDLATGRPIADVGPYVLNHEPVFAPDGRTFVVSDESGRFDFRDADTGRPVEAGPAVGPWTSRPSFSPDGRYLATTSVAERSVQLWDRATGRRVGSPLSRGSPNTTTLFSPDSRSLAIYSLGTARTLQVWDVRTGVPVTPAAYHGAEVSSLRFSPSGRRILTASGDGYVRVTDLAPDPRPVAEILAHARLLADRRLDDRGVLVPLARDDEQDLWQSFSARRGDAAPPK